MVYTRAGTSFPGGTSLKMEKLPCVLNVLTEAKLIKLPENLSPSTPRFFKATLISPTQWEKVGREIRVRGRTLPNTEVFIASQLGMNIVVGETPIGSPAKIRVYSDEKGYFSFDYYFPVTMRGLKASILVFAVDEKGHRSIPDLVNILLEAPDIPTEETTEI
jgi:hypothetical protein